MQNIRTKMQYPCEGCPKNKDGGCTDMTCRRWREWLKDAWSVVTSAVRDLGRRIHD